MNGTVQIILAGFGGQGVLFAGKLIAYAGMIAGREVSWLPSYGPEMRGGTCNCSVILSDVPIGSPIVNEPSILIAMNLPSLNRFEGSVANGGMIFYDSSLINRCPERTDVCSFAIDATKEASDHGIASLANMVLIGRLLKETGLFPRDTVEAALRKIVPPGKSSLTEMNLQAMALGGWE